MAIKSMKVEEAHEIAYWLAVDEDEYGRRKLTEKERFAITVLLQSYIDVSKKLEAYDNTDLIERDSVFNRLENEEDVITEYDFVVNVIENTPRFNPVKGSDE